MPVQKHNRQMAELTGFEPVNGGVKVRCLHRLATAQCINVAGEDLHLTCALVSSKKSRT